MSEPFMTRRLSLTVPCIDISQADTLKRVFKTIADEVGKLIDSECGDFYMNSFVDGDAFDEINDPNVVPSVTVVLTLDSVSPAARAAFGECKSARLSRYRDIEDEREVVKGEA